MAIDDMTVSNDYARLWNNKYDWTWGAADGAQSRLAPNGATYWCWGDTILGYPNPADASFDADRVMVSNTIMMQRGAELASATFSNGLPSVPDLTMNAVPRRFWVTDIIFPSPLPDKAFALCQRIHDDGGFIPDGSMIAEFDIQGDDRLLFTGNMHQTPSALLDVLDVNEIQWAQSFDEKDGYIYIYGFNTPGITGPWVTANRTYVARVSNLRLADKYAWQFWNGTTGWVAGRSATALAKAKLRSSPILDGQATCVRYDRRTDRWLLAQKQFSGFGATVQIYTATVPQGPFTLRTTINSPSGTSAGGHGYFTYNPTLHPRVDLATGKYLLSISHNGSGPFSDIFDERSLYKPDWQEITIP